MTLLGKESKKHLRHLTVECECAPSSFPFAPASSGREVRACTSSRFTAMATYTFNLALLTLTLRSSPTSFVCCLPHPTNPKHISKMGVPVMPTSLSSSAFGSASLPTPAQSPSNQSKNLPTPLADSCGTMFDIDATPLEDAPPAYTSVGLEFALSNPPVQMTIW